METVTGVEITVNRTGVEVDVKACVRSGWHGPRLCQAVLNSGVHRTVVTGFAVLFHDEVDDTGGAFGRVFSGRVGDELNLLDALCGHLTENIRAVIAIESGGLAVNPYLYVLGVTQGDITLLIHIDGWDILQHIRYACAGRSDVVTYGKDFLIQLKAHGRALSYDFYLFEVLRVLFEEEPT